MSSCNTEPSVDAPPVRSFRGARIAPIAGTLGELRTRIDDLDARIVALLAERGALVRDATRFKRDPRQVRAEARQAEVYARVRRLAESHAPDQPELPVIVEAAYRALVAGFVAAEARQFDETDPIAPSTSARTTP